MHGSVKIQKQKSSKLHFADHYCFFCFFSKFYNLSQNKVRTIKTETSVWSSQFRLKLPASCVTILLHRLVNPEVKLKPEMHAFIHLEVPTVSSHNGYVQFDSLLSSSRNHFVMSAVTFFKWRISHFATNPFWMLWWAELQISLQEELGFLAELQSEALTLSPNGK